MHPNHLYSYGTYWKKKTEIHWRKLKKKFGKLTWPEVYKLLAKLDAPENYVNSLPNYGASFLLGLS